MSDQCVVIVDAYAPTRRLGPRFKQAGFPCVRVQSTVEVPRLYRSSFDLADYCANIVHSGDLAATVQEVRRWDPIAVVAGGEIGVELADAMSESLGLPTNGTALSQARRDKFHMIDTIRAQGLSAARQLRIESAEHLRSWHQTIGDTIVLKPARSAASDGIAFCDTPDDSVRAYQRLAGATNIFSQINDSIVAQEYLRGTEYIVNTVSSEGRHHVCDIWRTRHIDVNGVRDLLASLHIVSRRGDIQDHLVDYAFRVLDAIGIRFGPAHIEIKMTPNGPCLIEIGARIGGGDNPHYAELATGESQLGWTVDAYVAPQRFRENYAAEYEVRHHVASVPMMSPYSGALKSYPQMERVQTLQSLYDIRIAVEPGQRLSRSVNDLTYPLIVNLRHLEEEVVMRDMETLRYLDGEGFYELVPAPPLAAAGSCSI